VHNSINLKVRMAYKKQNIFCDVNVVGPKIWGYTWSPYLPHSRASSRLLSFLNGVAERKIPTVLFNIIFSMFFCSLFQKVLCAYEFLLITYLQNTEIYLSRRMILQKLKCNLSYMIEEHRINTSSCSYKRFCG